VHNEILEILETIHPEYDYADSDDFITDGLLDSFDIAILVNKLEDKFNIFIDGTEINDENFKNQTTLISLVQKSQK
jgi:acyl carrier protein